MISHMKENLLEGMSSKSEASESSDDSNSNKVDHALGENAPIPDGDVSKSTEKLEINKKQKSSSSSDSIYSSDKKKLKLSEDKAAKPGSSNFTSVDETNEPTELDREKWGTIDENKSSELLLLRQTNSEETRNISTNAEGLIHPLLQIKQQMHQTEDNKTRKLDKLPIRGGKKLSSMNVLKELIESSSSASPNQTTKGKEKMASMNSATTSSGLVAPKQTAKGKEKKTFMNTPIKSSGPALSHLFDLEKIMRNKLAAVNAAAPWKGANNIRCSSPMDCTGQAKDSSNSSSNLENALALGSTPNAGNISTKTSATHPWFLNYKDIDDDWSELELEALLSFVKKYGVGNWNVKFGDPDLQIIRNKTARELAEKWEKVAPKMSPYLPNSCMLPVTADRSTLQASQGNRLRSIMDSTPIQLPNARFPIHRPSPRIGIPPLQMHEVNQALNWGRIKPLPNGIFGPHFQGSSSGAFHALHPLASAHPRKLNANFNTMNAQLLSQFQYERPNLQAQNFRPMSFQTSQTPPLSLGQTAISPPANVGTEARPQFLLGGSVLRPNNLRLNENAGHDTDNRK